MDLVCGQSGKERRGNIIEMDRMKKRHFRHSHKNTNKNEKSQECRHAMPAIAAPLYAYGCQHTQTRKN